MPKVSKRVAAFRRKCRDAHAYWATRAEECNPRMLRIGGEGKEYFWDLAIVGIGNQHGHDAVFIYDDELLVESYARNLIIEEGMASNEAWEMAHEWCDVNVTSAYVGPGTPIIRYVRGKNP